MNPLIKIGSWLMLMSLASGQSTCLDVGDKYKFYCFDQGCETSTSFACDCGFILELLQGDFNMNSEYVDIYINSVLVGRFVGGEEYSSDDPSWRTIGVFTDSILGTITLDSSNDVHPLADYNGIDYTIYARLTCIYSDTWKEQALSTSQPTLSPTNMPTTITPTALPSTSPSSSPTWMPSIALRSTVPSLGPTISPTLAPTAYVLSSMPSKLPTQSPTDIPSTLDPSRTPSTKPSSSPTNKPTTITPTIFPSTSPSSSPTYMPSIALNSRAPSLGPTNSPTLAPTAYVLSSMPSTLPTQSPTDVPSALEPSRTPSIKPTSSPTNKPTRITPTIFPSTSPSSSPTYMPSIALFSRAPSLGPTNSPTSAPTAYELSSMPSTLPTKSPTNVPSALDPSRAPSLKPTSSPTLAPSTRKPSIAPSAIPTLSPSISPTTAISSNKPTSIPTEPPTMAPSIPILNKELIIVEMVLCCPNQSELILTIEPVSDILGLKKSQLTILRSYATEDTRVLQYAMICNNITESAQVIEKLSRVNLIPFMDGYIELLSYAIMSMEGDSADGILEKLIPEENMNDYILFTNLVLIILILVFSCVCCYYRFRQKKLRKIGEDLIEFEDIEITLPGQFGSSPVQFSTSRGEKPGQLYHDKVRL